MSGKVGIWAVKNEQKNASTNCAGYGEDAITSYRLH